MSDVRFGKFILSDYSDALIVTDRHIAQLYGIEGNNVYFLPRGERAKNFDEVTNLCRWFVREHLTTNGLVVAVGGGSIGDAVGFACSIFKRGVNLLHVPTTLLAMVDSSIGGKTAIDLDGIKNVVGTYFFADALIDTNFLGTLDGEMTLSGYGEILKYRMLDARVDELCGNGASLSDIICACAQYKQKICAQDPFCKGERNVLNLGHTIGHAMEAALDIPHGVAVANGLYYETRLAAELGVCDSCYADRWRAEICKRFTIYPLSEQMLSLALQDKKNVAAGGSSTVTFVLPPEFGTYSIPFERVTELAGK